MNAWVVRCAVLGFATLGLMSCGQGGRPILDATAVSPDEFLITPQKPLETPADLTTLPEPTPGSRNRTDIDPNVRLAAALGGRTGGARGDDTALLRAVRAQSGGTTENIRETLAAEDAALRERRARRLKSLADDRQAALFYAPMMLDAYAEWQRLRAAGIRVPAAPPQE